LTFSQAKGKSKAKNQLDKEILWKLIVAADGHLATVAGVVGVRENAITQRLLGRYLGARWRAWKAAQSEIRRKGKQRRGWWRWRLRGMGIDPLSLDPSDPTWRACFVAPRGAAVRDAAAALRAAGVDVRTPAGILAVVDAVAARVANDAAALRRVAPDAPPGDGGHPVDSPGAAAAHGGHPVDSAGAAAAHGGHPVDT
jgi:hypothetical protein